MTSENDLKRVWNQKVVPVALRRTGKGEKLRIRLPRSTSDPNNLAKDFTWLRNNRARKPTWHASGKYWETPKNWFNDFVNRSLQEYNKIYIIQPYNEQEKCAPACQKAIGHECECSCMGAYHGTGSDGSWFEVSETFATRWLGRELAARLLTKKVEQLLGSEI